MVKPSILIASLLKPLKDSRAYYRLGLSLRETNKYRINIIGFSTKKEADEENIKFLPLFLKNRLSAERWKAVWNFFQVYKKERPDLTLICTWEYLPFAILVKMLYGGKLVYDVQENYALNIQHNQTLKGIRKQLAKGLILFFEAVGKPGIEYYLFSEQCYKHEKQRFEPYLVLENKFSGALIEKPIGPKKLPNTAINFLISGTITEVYGIQEAMDWFLNLQKSFPEISLHIIGHCPLQEFEKMLMEMADGNKGIRLDISHLPIPYAQILESYVSADVVLLPYRQIPSISPKIPSKLYECLALGIPFLHSPNALWHSFAEKYQAGFEVDFTINDQGNEIMARLQSTEFYNKAFPYEAFWAHKEKAQLQDLVNLLINFKH